MNILVINAGSSTLKYQLIDSDTKSAVAKGICERIGGEGSFIKHKSSGDYEKIPMPMKDHVDAMRVMVDTLMDAKLGVISDMSSIHAVGHRVVHGGDSFSGSVKIDNAVMDAIRENIRLAPLHNPANIQGIEACREIMPDIPQVAVFDTAFHQTMPQYAYMSGIPYEYYERLKVRRYGFHGTSHGFVAQRCAELMGKPIEELKIVTCHLGNGCSVAAVDRGKSVDTSMGLTPLEGVMMGTRSGDVDPAILEFLCKEENLSIGEVTMILNKKSGVEGLSDVGSDMRDLTDAVNAGNERALMTQDAYCYRIKKYIGAYAFAMGGLDAIVFTAGVGENDDVVREKATRGLEAFGVKIDVEKNNGNRAECDLTAEGAKVKVFLINTNEELAIARDTYALCK